MARDDYDVIVYKILLYFYGVMKRKIAFQEASFNLILSRAEIPPEYLNDILRMMQSEGLIEGAKIIRAWGNDYVMANDISEISITAAGIRYLKENSTMKKIGEALGNIPGALANLISIVKPL